MEFKPKITVASSLPSVSDGSLIVTTDTGELFVDTDSTRIKLSDVITGTESSIRALIAPITGKLYFATDTHKLLQAHYDGSTVTWTVLNEGGSGTGGGTYVGTNQSLITNVNLSSVTGNARGVGSIDLQPIRSNIKDVCSGANSFLFGQNSRGLADNGLCLGTGTRFDVDGAIQTNQNFTSSKPWSGHTGLIGKSFENVTSDIELFKINTATNIILQVQSLYITEAGWSELGIMNIWVWNGFLNYSLPSAPCSAYGWIPILSNNSIFLHPQYDLSLVQLGIWYTVFGAIKDDWEEPLS